jgi:hypothetical protein
MAVLPAHPIRRVQDRCNKPLYHPSLLQHSSLIRVSQNCEAKKMRTLAHLQISALMALAARQVVPPLRRGLLSAGCPRLGIFRSADLQTSRPFDLE